MPTPTVEHAAAAFASLRPDSRVPVTWSCFADRARVKSAIVAVSTRWHGQPGWAVRNDCSGRWDALPLDAFPPPPPPSPPPPLPPLPPPPLSLSLSLIALAQPMELDDIEEALTPSAGPPREAFAPPPDGVAAAAAAAASPRSALPAPAAAAAAAAADAVATDAAPRPPPRDVTQQPARGTKRSRVATFASALLRSASDGSRALLGSLRASASFNALSSATLTPLPLPPLPPMSLHRTPSGGATARSANADATLAALLAPSLALVEVRVPMTALADGCRCRAVKSTGLVVHHNTATGRGLILLDASAVPLSCVDATASFAGRPALARCTVKCAPPHPPFHTVSHRFDRVTHALRRVYLCRRSFTHPHLGFSLLEYDAASLDPDAGAAVRAAVLCDGSDGGDGGGNDGGDLRAGDSVRLIGLNAALRSLVKPAVVTDARRHLSVGLADPPRYRVTNLEAFDLSDDFGDSFCGVVARAPRSALHVADADAQRTSPSHPSSSPPLLPPSEPSPVVHALWAAFATSASDKDDAQNVIRGLRASVFAPFVAAGAIPSIPSKPHTIFPDPPPPPFP